jgi:hypothetical protein
MAIANSYIAVGNVEDLSNVITNISPSETPILSSAARGKAIGVVHSWLEDDLRAPKQNAVAEGAAFAVEDPRPRKMLFNVTQIMSHGYAVTGTQEAVAKHGVKSELGYQMQKAAKELALDHELALLRDGDMVTEGTYGAIQGAAPNQYHSYSGAGVAGTMVRQFKGLPAFITTNQVNGAFTEDAINNAIQASWESGGNPKRAYMSPANKKVASAFTDGGNRTVNMNDSDKKLYKVIRFYESDFGVVEFMPHRLMTDDLVLVLDPTFIKLADLRPVHRETMPRTADSVNGLLLGETTLEVRAEMAHCRINVA